MLALALLFLARQTPPPVVHSVCDLSQEFTFYMDGRFHRQYLREVGRDARNWGSLHRLELSNVNLLVLSQGHPNVPYSQASIEHVGEYARDGGTVLLLIDGAEPMPPGAALAERFGARPTTERAQEPLEGELESYGGTVLALGEGWRVLARDADGRPVCAGKDHGRGAVLVASRGLFGREPDGSDPINAEWLGPLLVEHATRKRIDPSRPPSATWAEHEREVGPLTLEFHDGTERFADAIAKEYQAVRPHLVALTGVEPAPGMIQKLLVLPTGGGGFSSGERIAIGAWWGGYPDVRYPMIELLGHEAGHSWVLPHAEPLWNEPIATYLGILAGERMEMSAAREALEHTLAAGRRLDPDYTALDPLSESAPRELVWGKSFFVFEELERRHGPGALAKYFRAKRALALPERPAYTMDDCVAVWSHAVEEDLFPWFRSLAFPVDAERTDLWPK